LDIILINFSSLFDQELIHVATHFVALDLVVLLVVDERFSKLKSP